MTDGAAFILIFGIWFLWSQGVFDRCGCKK